MNCSLGSSLSCNVMRCIRPDSSTPSQFLKITAGMAATQSGDRRPGHPRPHLPLTAGHQCAVQRPGGGCGEVRTMGGAAAGVPGEPLHFVLRFLLFSQLLGKHIVLAHCCMRVGRCSSVCECRLLAGGAAWKPLEHNSGVGSAMTAAFAHVRIHSCFPTYACITWASASHLWRLNPAAAAAPGPEVDNGAGRGAHVPAAAPCGAAAPGQPCRRHHAPAPHGPLCQVRLQTQAGLHTMCQRLSAAYNSVLALPQETLTSQAHAGTNLTCTAPSAGPRIGGCSCIEKAYSGLSTLPLQGAAAVAFSLEGDAARRPPHRSGACCC